MKIIIFGATGGLGQSVWKTAVDAGHTVVVYVRSPSKLDPSDGRFASLTVVQGDVMDTSAVAAATQGCEVIVNCTSPAGGHSALEMAQSIVPQAAASGARDFYMIGGMGALWVPGTQRSVLVQDWSDASAMAAFGLDPKMPQEVIRKMTKGHLASMNFMDSTGLDHTFICPGAMTDGSASETRTVTLDELGGRDMGRVAYQDVAETIVEDIGVGRLMGHRVCVARA